jgi:hypothetical protein
MQTERLDFSQPANDLTDEVIEVKTKSKIVELNMDVNEITPRHMNVEGIDEASQVKNK